jgi:hypothetical protein
MIDALGWVATALFAVSYLTKKPAHLRWVQAGAACLWVVYGALIGAAPVVVANVVVASLALFSLLRLPQSKSAESKPSATG